MCNHTRVYVQLTKYMDAVGIPTYAEKTKFHFKCSLMEWANNKIWVFYKINETYGATAGEFINDSEDKHGKQFLNDTEKYLVHFKKDVSAWH